MTTRILPAIAAVFVAVSSAFAQGPSPAIVQQAIRALLAGNNSWAGTNTFQAITVTSCTGCGAPAGTISGALTAGQVPYATGTTTIASEAALAYNATTDALTVGGSIDTPLVSNTAGVVDIEMVGGGSAAWRNLSGSIELSATDGSLIFSTFDGVTAGASLVLNDDGSSYIVSQGNETAFFNANGTTDFQYAVSAPTITRDSADLTLSTTTSGDLVLSPIGTVEVNSDAILANGKALKTDPTTAHTGLFQAYDVNDAVYRTFGTATNGNTPTFAWAAPAGGSLTGNFSTLQVGGVSLAPSLSATTGSIGGGLLSAGACTSGTVAVTSSTTAMAVAVSPNTYPGDGSEFFGYVSANGTVTVKVCALVAVTPAASTYNVRVIQ